MTEEQDQMVKDCAARVQKLNSWEASFIDDLMVKEPAVLSKKQDEKLAEIWDRVT